MNGERALTDEALTCPTCGGRITSDETLWTWMTKWYCSEKCVRKAVKRQS